MILIYEFEQKCFSLMDDTFDVFRLRYKILFRERNPKIILGHFGL